MSGHSAASSARPGWGILATGGIARLFTRDLLAHGHRVVAVGSRREDAARAFAETWSIDRWHASYEALAGDPDVDIVYIATPPARHLENALAALAHGKHVLVEKPFTVNEVEARRIIDEARARGLVALEAMWTSYLPHIEYVRQRIRSGDIGEISMITAQHGQRLMVNNAHRLRSLALGGGALLDLGVYPLWLVQEVAGEPLDLSAHAIMTPSGVDGSVATVTRHAGGALGTTYSSMTVRTRNDAVISGSSGRLELSTTWYEPTSVALVDGSGAVVDRFDGRVSGRGMQYEAAEMERLVLAGKDGPVLAKSESTLAVMRAMDRVRAAIGLQYPADTRA